MCVHVRFSNIQSHISLMVHSFATQKYHCLKGNDVTHSYSIYCFQELCTICRLALYSIYMHTGILAHTLLSLLHTTGIVAHYTVNVAHYTVIITHYRPYIRVTWMEQEYMRRTPYVRKTRYVQYTY